MAGDLFDLYDDIVGDQLVNQASRLSGEPSRNISSAMAIVLPTLIGTLIQKAGTEAGARGLKDFLAANNLEGSKLSKIGGLLSGGVPTDTLLKSGSEVLKYLMGDKLGLVIDHISESSMVKTSTAGNLMKMTAPFLLGILGKYIKQTEPGASGIKEYLQSHRAKILKSVPPGITELLGFANLTELGDGADKQRDQLNRKMENTGTESKSTSSKLLPWLVLLLAALALLYFLNRGCAGAKNKSAEVLESTEESLNESAKSAASGDTSSAIVKKEVGAGTSTDVAKSPAQSSPVLTQISEAIASGTVDPNRAFILNKGEFQGISAVLTPGSEAELDQFATILKANPNVHIRIEAHTDNSGSADINMQLSTQQALTIMTSLQSRGIALNRMVAIGRGQTKPLAANDTAEGKDRNKRIEIYLVKE